MDKPQMLIVYDTMMRRAITENMTSDQLRQSIHKSDLQYVIRGHEDKFRGWIAARGYIDHALNATDEVLAFVGMKDFDKSVDIVSEFVWAFKIHYNLDLPIFE